MKPTKPDAPEVNFFELVLASSIHDMKNSIGLLLGKLDVISKDFPIENTSKNPDHSGLKLHGQQIQRNLIQLLTLYRIQNKQYCLNIDEYYIEEFFDDIINTCLASINQEQIKLKTSCIADLFAYFDYELVTGILHNILGNAYRYAKSQVTISAMQNEERQLVITVSDDGPGYPPQMLQSLTSENATISFSTGNTGLGLFFSSLVAEMHVNKDKHGYISLDNNGINNGGRFRLVLP